MTDTTVTDQTAATASPAPADALMGGGKGSAPAASPDPAAAASEAAPWWAGLPDAAEGDALSHRKWAENKGYKSIEDAVSAHRALEKLMGGDKIALPKAPDDPAWAGVWDKLGRPADPKGYELAIEGEDAAAVEAFAAQAHKLGLSKDQARGVAGYYQQLRSSAEQQLSATALADSQAVVKSWGAEAPAKQAALTRGATAAGLDSDQVNSLIGALGAKAAAAVLLRIGEAATEDAFVAGTGGGSDRITPENVAARRAAFLADDAKTKALIKGDPKAMSEWQAIIKADAARLDRLAAQ
jgi:hypothetical protein